MRWKMVRRKRSQSKLGIDLSFRQSIPSTVPFFFSFLFFFGREELFASRARSFFFSLLSSRGSNSRRMRCGGWAFFNMEMEGPPPLARE